MGLALASKSNNDVSQFWSLGRCGDCRQEFNVFHINVFMNIFD